MTVTPENLHKSARLIAAAAKEIEAKGMPDHAQQLADRASQVESWAWNLTHYRRDGVKVSVEWINQIGSATDEFLAFAGHPQQEQARGRHISKPEQRRNRARQPERIR